MQTALLVFITITAAAVIFLFGVLVGGCTVGKRIIDTIDDALDESNLTAEQQIAVLDNIQKETKKRFGGRRGYD